MSFTALHTTDGDHMAVAGRDVLINLRVSAEERAQLAAIADANDEPYARTVRRWIARFYKERFGGTSPKVKGDRR
jgi:hypothetical protein